MSATPASRLDQRRRALERQDQLVTRPAVGDAVLTVARGVLIAVVTLIILGQLYATQVVAEPWFLHDPSFTVEDEGQPGSTGYKAVNVTGADHYYDNGTHAETVTNQTSGATLTEGTDYEFWTNGTLRLTGTHGTHDVNITYSGYNVSTFQGMITTFANYGVVAYTMIGLGLIAVGASVALAFFGGFASGDGGR